MIILEGQTNRGESLQYYEFMKLLQKINKSKALSINCPYNTAKS
jgi:hypothetical protein